MSVGMTLSFTPEVQITKNYCKSTMKLHWVYIGTYTANKRTKRQMNQSVLRKIESNHASVFSSGFQFIQIMILLPPEGGEIYLVV